MYDYDEGEPYIPPTPKRRASANVGRDTTFYERATESVQRPPPKKKRHYLFWLGLGMIVFLGIWSLYTMVIVPWYDGIETQWHYGDPPRVTELKADFHHGGVSTLLAFDNSGQVTVVELIGEKVNVYTGGNFTPETTARTIYLTTMDVNHDGKMDVVIHVVGMDGAMVLWNTGSSFSWSPS
jgi:hypothetical protein